MSKTLSIFLLLFPFLILVSGASAGETEEHYYAIEQNRVISGYAHVVISQTEFNGRPCIQLIDSLWMQVTALGKSLDARYRFEYRLDPSNGMYFYHTSFIDQGGTIMEGRMEVLGDSMLIVSENDSSRVALPPGTVRQNTRLHRHLVDYFIKDTLSQKECPVFSETDGSVHTIAYRKWGSDQLELEGRKYDALRVDVVDRTTGVQYKLWVDPNSGLLLKTLHPFRNGYLSDVSVKDRVGRGDLSFYLFAPANKVITNPWDISYIKVQAKLQPGGLWLTPEALNVPGQKFGGTVQDNRVDGVFEINRERYDGADAPPFPCDFSDVDSLQRYLKPSQMIESDDTSLVREARRITAGAKDAWDAATRLSQWVHKEILPDIPGGGTALRTYQMRLGECGSHSNLLTAFCRAVGIPARGVFGCMYVPDQGGGFGQHGWNEIYMGKAGWIQVDCTLEEITYADCGHIRLGEWTSAGGTMFNPEKMEILDYRVGADSSGGKSETVSEVKYDSYVGKYQGDKGELGIVVQNGSLGLDIPNRNMVFELRDPDENGNWFFKLSNAASISFATDSAGAIASMTISERQKLLRKPPDDSVAADVDVPEALRPLIGEYPIPMQNVTLGIVFLNGELTLRMPGGRTFGLSKTDSEGEWLAERSQNTKMVMSFDTDETGQASAMNLITHSTCQKMAATGGK